MDFTHGAYFQGGPPYQFPVVGAHLPPLTPAQSNSVASEEFNNTSSPVCCVPASLSEKEYTAERDIGRDATEAWGLRPAFVLCLCLPAVGIGISYPARLRISPS